MFVGPGTEFQRRDPYFLYEPLNTSFPVVVYQRSQFVVWGGNEEGIDLGDRVNFWGGTWDTQITSGDYEVKGPFLGYAVVPPGPVTLCQSLASTTSAPPLDDSCWHSKGGNISPPESLPQYIQVIVSTSMSKLQGTVFGNTAATAVVRVEPGYASHRNYPGYGQIVDVIADGAALFPGLAYTGARTLEEGVINEVSARVVESSSRQPMAGVDVTFTLSDGLSAFASVVGVTTPDGVATADLDVPVGLTGQLKLTLMAAGQMIEVPLTITTATGSNPASSQSVVECASTLLDPCLTGMMMQMITGNEGVLEQVGLTVSATDATAPDAVVRLNTAATLTGTRYSIYSPEMTLLAETSLSTPTIAHEYVWFAGVPVAQIDHERGETRWTVTDHLGTPKVQTSSTGEIVWHAEHEPYGQITELRAGAGLHQPLRFPGQEAELVPGSGPNGVTEQELQHLQMVSTRSGTVLAGRSHRFGRRTEPLRVRR